jgi:hypothetical protein
MSRQREASEGGHCHALTLLPQTRHRMGWDGMVLEILYCIVLRIRTPPHSGHELLTR